MQLRYFSADEFSCKCGCGLGFNDMDQDLMIRLDEARGFAGVPFSLSSAMRCQRHNKAVGGSATSSHMSGFAVDIEAVDDQHRFSIIDALLKAGFNRIGVSESFVHVDSDPNKNRNRLWSY